MENKIKKKKKRVELKKKHLKTQKIRFGLDWTRALRERGRENSTEFKKNL